MDERWFLVFGFFLLIIIYVDGAACGNAVLEEGEFCDIGKMNGGNCTNFNYTGGSLLCSDDCSEYDFNQCEGEDVCGNGVIGDGELCESSNIRGRTCENEGYEGGTLKCRIDCIKYDYSECTGSKTVCGDNEITGLEECEGNNLNEKECSDLDYTSGVLRCVNCKFDFGLCFKDINETIEENVDVNLTEENLTENVNNEIPSGVVGATGDVNKFDFGFSLKNWLIVFGGFLIIGIVLIWLFIFRIKK